MRYHLFQKTFEKVVKIKETSFLLSKCLISISQHCKTKNFNFLPQNHPGFELSSVWSQLSVNEFGLIILDGNRLFVPKGQRKTLLQFIHAAHCRTDKTKRRATELFFWPQMSIYLYTNVKFAAYFYPLKVGNP